MMVALDAWGDVPDWINALVKACDAPGSSQNKVAKLIGVNGSAISQLIRKTYPANTSSMEYRVRAVLMPEIINCPALGPLESSDCLRCQDIARKPLMSATPYIVRMHRQCRRCPKFREAPGT